MRQAAQCAEFIIGPAKGRTRRLIAPYIATLRMSGIDSRGSQGVKRLLAFEVQPVN
jgi:hypothetical protein